VGVIDQPDGLGDDGGRLEIDEDQETTRIFGSRKKELESYVDLKLDITIQIYQYLKNLGRVIWPDSIMSLGRRRT
jgi:hypothetical protein